MAEINPIGPRAGSPAEQYAGAGAMVVSGLEKDINKLRGLEAGNQPQVFLAELGNFMEAVQESKIVEEPTQRKEKQKRNLEQEREFRDQAKIRADTSPNAAIIRSGFSFATNTQESNPPEEISANLEKVGAPMLPDPKVLKEYAVLYARKLAGIPADKMDSVSLRLLEIEHGFAANKAVLEILASMRHYIEQTIVKEISFLIKEFILKNLSSPQNLLEYLLNANHPIKILSYVFFNEIVGRPQEYRFSMKDSLEARLLKEIASRNLKFENIDIPTLIKTAKEMGVDLSNWINLWNFEKIQISPEGRININTAFLDTEHGKSMLLDELRLVEVERLMENRWINLAILTLRSRRLQESLAALGEDPTKIKETRSQAQRIAWIKTITLLKETHLKRIFSTSYRDFLRHSRTIASLTIRARSLGLGITTQGARWIEKKLSTLALDTANYKLNLLKSVQKIGFDKKREKEIRQLQNAINTLREREEQITILSRTSEAMKDSSRRFIERLLSIYLDFFR